MMIKNSPLGQLVPKSFITMLKLLLQNTATVRLPCILHLLLGDAHVLLTAGQRHDRLGS